VTVDDVRGGQLLADHLVSQGHRHVLIKQTRFPLQSAAARVDSFARRCINLQIAVTMGMEGAGDAISDSDLSVLTAQKNRATAVMAWSDALAEAICDSLTVHRLGIPNDVAVVGFDGFHHRRRPHDLTTIQAPWHEVGKEAVFVLRSQIEGTPFPDVTCLPVSFYRGSTT